MSKKKTSIRMKSVKNFFIERMSSIDHSDSSSTGGGGSGGGTSKKLLSKLKCSNSSDDIVDLATATSPTIAALATTPPTDAATPTTASISSASCNNNSSPATTAAVQESPFNFNTQKSATTVSVDSNAAASDALPSTPTALKPQKSRRKISLPWFRQSSCTTAHIGLTRQHTIDSPGSFRLFRRPSSNFKVGTQEATWVVSDYIATPGSNELSVSKGQQVEVVEAPSVTLPDFCLVRLNPQNDDAAAQEGLVPVSILKPQPSAHKTAAAAAARKENNDAIPEQSNNRGKPDPLTSSTKRRGFSGRKWLPQPLRKLSQSKVEKTPPEKTLIKKSSEKNLRLPHKHTEHEDEYNTAASNTTATLTTTTTHSHQTSHYSATASQHQIAPTSTSQTTTAQQDYEAEEEAGLELPPPMKPIQEPHLNGPPTFTKDLKENAVNMASAGKMDGNPAVDLSEIEQIVKEKTEQHEEKSKILKPTFDLNNFGGNNGESNGRSSGELDLCYNANNENSNNINDNNDEQNNTEASDVESAQKKRMCALNELITTEADYIKDLSEIVNGYIAEIRNPNSDIPLPDDLKGDKVRMVFGNIEAVYEWHRDYFHMALQRCQKSPGELAPLIKRYDRKFNMYIVYCQNKPVSEHIVNEHYLYFEQIRMKLGHRLDLNTQLIKPVQRLTKYELLLKEITKHTERAGLIEEAACMKDSYHVMKVVCKAVNDTMVLRCLQKFEGKITAQGKLLLHGPLTCIEDARSTERNACMVQKPRELQVFLFEQNIIFSDIVGKKTQYPSFIYRSHIQVNKMQLEELPNNRFLLKTIDPNRPELHMICYAATVDLNREWLETIRNILQLQHDLVIALTAPIQHQKDLAKET